MDNTNKSSRYKNIADNILKIENNFHDKIIKLQYKSSTIDKCKVINIMKYLNSTDYKDYKFNQYSIREAEECSTITFNYISPNSIFTK